MRAPQDEHVDPGALERLEVFARDQLGGRMLEPCFLDERHEQRTWVAVHARVGPQRFDRALVCAACDGAGRADHADVTGARRRHSRARAGLDDADDRHGRLALQGAECMRGTRVTRHDHGLHAALQQERENLCAVAADRVGRLGSIGHARRVAEIDHRLPR